MSWQADNLAHRYTQSFFIGEYNDPTDDVYRDGVKLKELNYQISRLICV